MLAPQPIVHEGPVVRLEPLSTAHRDEIAAAATSDAAVFIRYGPLLNAGGVDGWLDEALGERGAGTRQPFAVRDVASGVLVGSSSYLDIAPADGRIEIGHTWYGGQWQGTRVNPAAKLLMLAHAFDELGATRVTLKTDALNERSRRAILGIGATFEGVLRGHSRRYGGPGLRDTAMYSILPAEWPAVRAGLERRSAG